MTEEPRAPVFGNAVDASKDTRGWFMGHFIPGREVNEFMDGQPFTGQV